jgi:eukaryotic-like serine/threonine-protein kinase
VADSDRSVDFEIVGRVASSATATVWKARDRRLDRMVALKVLEAPTETLRAAWRNEARVLASLSSPNIVAVYGYAERNGQPMLVEEWVDGATVSEVLATNGSLSPAQALGVVRGALVGLAAVHEAGLAHGDV